MSIVAIEELNLLHERICRAIGDPTRLWIMYALHAQPRHVTALAAALGLSQPTISRHLGILRRRRLVYSERDGSLVVYHLADERIITVLDIMRNVLRDILEQEASLLK